MSKVLLSGSHGFIGSWLASRIESQGDEVIALSRTILQDKAALQSFMTGHKPDYIIHAGAYGNMRGQQDEQKIYQANVQATWNLLSTTKDIDYKAFINISTSSVYGEKMTPMDETDTLNTTSFYGASKVAGEYFVRAFAHKYNKPVFSVRPFSVYGEGEADFRFIPTVIRSMITGEEMQLAISPPHDFIHVDDFCRLTLELTKHVKMFQGEALNIGTGKQTENGDIVAMLQDISGKKANITGMLDGNNHEWVAGRSMMHDWKLKPEIDLYDGLQRCWKFYKDKYGK